MRKLAFAALSAALSLGAFADTPNMAYDLWPKDRVAMFKPLAEPEGVAPMKDDVMRVQNVSVPQVVVTPVPGAKKPTPAVVICPGGGYHILAWNHEGVEVAQWLKDHGVAGVILKYRVPGRRDAAFADAQRAIRWVRANAEKFNIDPGKVGIMGFSAGAHLAVRTATNFRQQGYEPVDEVDAQSCRPDFQMPIYPAYLLKDDGSKAFDAGAYPLGKDTPRAFLVQTEDDFCQIETSLGYYAALKAAGVPAELHVFEKGGHGGHGYGVRRLGFPTDAWPALAAEWLKAFVE